jgi:predicted nucleic-acid-binding protein
MTGLDTNVLVRFLVRDDAAQYAQAERLMRSFTADDSGWIAQVVLLEVVWVLTSIYRLSRPTIAAELLQLLEIRHLALQEESVAREAIERYSRGKAGFADCLIAASARAAGCARTVTFDRVAARDAGMELIG